MTATPEAWAVAAAGAAREVVEGELAAVAGVRNAAEARLVDLVVRALAGGLWEGHRVHTPVQWLMWRAGVARAMAVRVVALARRAPVLPVLPVLPVTMAMVAEGRLSFDQAACVARYAPAEFEASVAPRGPRWRRGPGSFSTWSPPGAGTGGWPPRTWPGSCPMSCAAT